MGVPIDEEYFRKRPTISKDLFTPQVRESMMEVYDLLCKYPYTLRVGMGMGADMSIAPDMLKLDEIAKKKDIDIFRYEDYCFLFVRKKTEQEHKKEN